jgi:hypothetical protein
MSVQFPCSQKSKNIYLYLTVCSFDEVMAVHSVNVE